MIYVPVPYVWKKNTTEQTLLQYKDWLEANIGPAFIEVAGELEPGDWAWQVIIPEGTNSGPGVFTSGRQLGVTFRQADDAMAFKLRFGL